MANPTLLLDTKVEIQSTTAAPVNITGISKASEAVVTAANSLEPGDIVIIDAVVGMSQINGYAVRVKAATESNFTCEGLDSTDFSDYVSGGTFQEVTAFLAFDNLTSFSIPEPEPNYEDYTTIHDLEVQEIPGLDSALTANFNMIADPTSVAVVELRKASKSKTARVFKVVLQTGRVLLVNARPSGGRGFDGANPGAVATASGSLKFVREHIWYAS